MEGTGSVMKQFKVVDMSKQKKQLLLYESYESFIRKCKAKFNISEDSKVFFVFEEDIDTEVDCDVLERLAPDKSVLIIKIDGIDQNETDEHAHILDESQDDESDKQVQPGQREIQEQPVRKENRNKDMQNIQKGEEKEKKYQLRETKTEANKGASNIDELEKLEEGNEVKDHIVKYGLNDIGVVLKRHLNKWKECPLHIAVTGASGKGKSSFINALRGLTERDPGAAEVDVGECTKIPTPYQHPKYENFVIWDVPGVGTKNFPKKSYLEKIEFKRYDFFIVITSERFTEIDAWLLKEVWSRNKHCYIVRTKIDNDLTNEKRKAGKGHFDEMNVFNSLKKRFLQEVIDSVDDDTKFDFFVISNHSPRDYDFPDMELQLLKDVPPAKKSAMVFGVAGMSANVVKAKADELRSRIHDLGVISGVGALIPVPFLSTGLDVAIILEEVLFYRSQFALDDSSLEKLAEMSGVTLAELKEEVKLETPSILFSAAGIIQFLGKYVANEAAEKIVKFFIPVIGSAISCGISYHTTTAALTAILMMMEKDAFKVLQYVAKKSFSKDS